MRLTLFSRIVHVLEPWSTTKMAFKKAKRSKSPNLAASIWPVIPYWLMQHETGAHTSTEASPCSTRYREKDLTTMKGIKNRPR